MERVTFTLRLPTDLRDTIKEKTPPGVSLNETILEALIEKYKTGDNLEQRVNMLEQRFAQWADCQAT